MAIIKNFGHVLKIKKAQEQVIRANAVYDENKAKNLRFETRRI